MTNDEVLEIIELQNLIEQGEIEEEEYDID